MSLPKTLTVLVNLALATGVATAHVAGDTVVDYDDLSDGEVVTTSTAALA